MESQMEEFMPSSVMQLINRVSAISEISCQYRHNRDRLTDEKWRRSEWPLALCLVAPALQPCP